MQVIHEHKIEMRRKWLFFKVYRVRIIMGSPQVPRVLWMDFRGEPTYSLKAAQQELEAKRRDMNYITKEYFPSVDLRPNLREIKNP